MRESSALKEQRLKWSGKTISFMGRIGTVVGIGDDGHKCDYDARRRHKPTGILFCKDRLGVEFDALDSISIVLPQNDV